MVSNHAIMLTILQKLGYETIQGVDAFRCAWNHRFLDIWEKINSSNVQKIDICSKFSWKNSFAI